MDGNSGNHGPPKGPPPEYSKKMHEQSVRCQNTVVAVACLFVFLNILFVILRVIARRIVKKTPWFWDDYTVFLGLLFNLAIQIVAIVVNVNSNEKYALSKPMSAKLKQASSDGKAFYATLVVFNFAVALPKISVCCLYLRIFENGQRYVRIATWITFGLICVTCVAYTIATPFFIYPLSETGGMGNSGPYIKLEKSVNVPLIVTDIVMLLLPIKTAMSVKASPLKRFGIFLTLATGGVGLVASVVRWSYFLQYKNPPSSALTATINVLTIVEPSMCQIASCLPPLGGLLRIMSARFVSNPSLELRRLAGQDSSDHGSYPKSPYSDAKSPFPDAKSPYPNSPGGFSRLHDFKEKIDPVDRIHRFPETITERSNSVASDDLEFGSVSREMTHGKVGLAR